MILRMRMNGCASLRKSEAECRCNVRWGTHWCQFYETRQDLLEIVVPFLKAGFACNEYCLWILPKGGEAAGALETLRSGIPGADACLRRGQLELVLSEDWYRTDGSFDQEQAFQAMKKQLGRMRAAGFRGMRITGDAAWVGRSDWKVFQAYEERITNAIGALPVTALCTYSRNDLGAAEIIEVTRNHHGSIIRQDGEWRRFESPAPAKKSSGPLIDIMDRRTVERTLVETERRFRSMLETVKLIAIMLDSKGNIVFCNDFLLGLTGWSRTEIAGKSWIDMFIPGDLRDELRKLFRADAGPDRFPVHHENPIVTRKGEQLLISWNNTVLLDTRGNITGLACIGVNITEQKRAEEAIRQADAELRRIISSISDYVWSADAGPQGRMTLRYFSPVIEKISGYPPELVMEDPGGWLKIIHAEDRPRFTSAFNRILSGASAREELEYRITRKDGATCWVRDSVVARRLDHGRIRLDGVMSDISKRKQTEEQNILYHKQLTRLSSELSRVEDNERRRIAADLHDHIGQTLALAKIKLGALREATAASGPDRSWEELRGLIDESIRYTRTLTYELGIPVLYELGLEAALDWLAENMREKYGLDVTTEILEHTDGFSDETRLLLYKSVRELLMNVVKHARTNAARVRVAGVDGAIRIVVEDDGAGYPFTGDLLPGALGGFGLFSIRERMKRAGGSLRIDTAPGRGTRAVLTMPLPPTADNASS